jgi:hypothetical protein
VQMTLHGGKNFVSAKPVDMEVAPGAGRIVCPECGGDQECYRSLFPPELGVRQCVDCKGTGFILISI